MPFILSPFCAIFFCYGQWVLSSGATKVFISTLRAYMYRYIHKYYIYVCMYVLLQHLLSACCRSLKSCLLLVVAIFSRSLTVPLHCAPLRVTLHQPSCNGVMRICTAAFEEVFNKYTFSLYSTSATSPIYKYYFHVFLFSF